jgi:hypothetical protein
VRLCGPRTRHRRAAVDEIGARASLDEELCQSLMKNRTMSKSRKVIVPEPLIPSDSDDDVCRPQQCKRNRAIPALGRAGRKAKYIRRRSNLLPVMSSNTFASREAKAGGRGRK